MKYLFIFLSLFFSAIACEAILFFVTKSKPLELPHKYFYENFYYHYQLKNISKKDLTVPFHDERLGWKPEIIQDPQWPILKKKLEKDKRIRILLLGDSFMRGWQVKKTIGQYLQERLGNKYWVINLAAWGYGFDQILLLSHHYAKDFNPSLMIMGFIADDLQRSCFDFQFDLKKPIFYFSNGKLTSTSVPTPKELYENHRQSSQQIIDALITWSLRSNLVKLFGQFVFQKKYNACINSLNTKLIEWHHRHSKFRYVLFHMHGELPKEFENKIPENVAYLSSPNQIAPTAQKLKVEPLYHQDGHPKESLNEIYADILYEKFFK